MRQEICFFDIETGGLQPGRPIIQVAAVAVDEEWLEVEVFERKVKFSEADAEPEALAINHYRAEDWVGAVSEIAMVLDFAKFLNKHKCVEKISRAGKPYKLAKLGGHNIAGFDVERMAAVFKKNGEFFPGAMSNVLDTLHGAAWFFHGAERQPKSFKLVDLAEHFGIEAGGAHDALVDVRLSIQIAARILPFVAGNQA